MLSRWSVLLADGSGVRSEQQQTEPQRDGDGPVSRSANQRLIRFGPATHSEIPQKPDLLRTRERTAPNRPGKPAAQNKINR
jgi:hypothetical protein